MRHLPRLKLIGEPTNYQTLQYLQSDNNLVCNTVVLAGPKLEDTLLHRVDHSLCFREQLNFKNPPKPSQNVPSAHYILAKINVINSMGRLQMHRKAAPTPGVPGFGLHCHEDFYELGEWSRIHPTEFALPPCIPVGSCAWTLGSESNRSWIRHSLPKIWNTARFFLRVRFLAQEPAEQTYIILGWWQKGDIECWEPAERYCSSSAFALSWPSSSTGEHCTAQQTALYLDFCHRWAGSENSGGKKPH